jgi:hypothetical protein
MTGAPITRHYLVVPHGSQLLEGDEVVFPFNHEDNTIFGPSVVFLVGENV